METISETTKQETAQTATILNDLALAATAKRPTTQTINLTREEAQLIVDYHGFEHQRDLDWGHIAHLADLMHNDEFLGISQLSFAVNGDGLLRLVDGNHRLHAAIEYWAKSDNDEVIPFTAQVLAQSPSEAYAQLDSAVKVRSSAVIGTALQLPVPKNILRPALSISKYALFVWRL